MTLRQLYDREGFAGLKALAGKTNSSAKYLYQCATGRRDPSHTLARRIADADSRLSLQELRSDIFGKAA